MEFIPIFYDFLVPLFLFGLVFCGFSIFTYTSSNFQSTYPSKLVQIENPIVEFNQKSAPFTELFEQTSVTVLTGQAYHLATPLMIPIACLLEDAPETVLTGQSYQLATPLMSSLSCILEDAPESVLKGQAYHLATPLMTPIACIVKQTWHQFYRAALGNPGINYWEWQDKPESRNICQELSLLLDLPAPQGYAKEILESLAEVKYSFSQANTNQESSKNGNLLTNFEDYKSQGKFNHREFQIQTKMYLAFQQWHNHATQLIGQNSLQSIYQVCYGTTWEMIQQIIHEHPKSQTPNPKLLDTIFTDESAPWWKILGVRSSANPLQVEKAYKKLIRTWHPDINKHPYATEVTSRINVAYEQYQSRYQLVSLQDNPLSKIREWIKPFFSR